MAINEPMFSKNKKNGSLDIRGKEKKERGSQVRIQGNILTYYILYPDGPHPDTIV